MWNMSRFLLPFSFSFSFFLSSFSPSVIHYISKQHQNSHRPFSSEISKRNVIACKASNFLPSTFLLWEVYLSWLFLVSDSFFFLSFFLFYYYASTTHSLTHCLTVLMMDTYLTHTTVGQIPAISPVTGAEIFEPVCVAILGAPG